jgi:molybdopterin-guanine dinucleotide biosynthesis protein A
MSSVGDEGRKGKFDVEATSAIILAGGRSRRMGEDKALLPYNGVTLIEHVLATLRPLTANLLVVADRPDKYPLAQARALGDLFPDCGPLGGIVTGLTEAGEGAHLVVGCDMPFLNLDVLRLLLAASGPEWDAVVPEVGGQWEPLCAVYRHTACPKLRRFLVSGGRALQSALNTLAINRIDEETIRRLDPHLRGFTNVNTPAERQALERNTP